MGHGGSVPGKRELNLMPNFLGYFSVDKIYKHSCIFIQTNGGF